MRSPSVGHHPTRCRASTVCEDSPLVRYKLIWRRPMALSNITKDAWTYIHTWTVQIHKIHLYRGVSTRDYLDIVSGHSIHYSLLCYLFNYWKNSRPTLRTGSVRTEPLPSLTKSTVSNGREVNGIDDQADYEDCQESATALPPSARSNTSALIDFANPYKYTLATTYCL